MSQGGTPGCWRGRGSAEPSHARRLLGRGAPCASRRHRAARAAMPWCRRCLVFRVHAAPAVFTLGVYSKSLSGCLSALLSAITRRQVSGWGCCQRGAASFGNGERVMLSAGLAPDAPAPYGVSYWENPGVASPSPQPHGAGTARCRGVNGADLAGGCRAVTPSCPQGSEPPVGWAGGSDVLPGWARSSRGARPR